MENDKKQLYDEEPVYFCRHCLSLRIKNIPEIEDSDFCDDCGSMSIGRTTIEKWETAYKYKYKKTYLENGRNGKKKRWRN